MEELDLKELFEVFWSRKIYIALITLVFLLVGVVYSFIFVEPEYKAETTLLLVQQGDNANQGSEKVTTSDLTLNQKLVSTYSELITSKTVAKTVIQNLGIDMSEELLQKSITVSTVKDTEIIKITVVNENAKNAKIIANEIVNVFADEVKARYNIDNVGVVDEAEIEEEPYNINHIRDLAIFIFIGLVVAAIYALVANMLDTTIKSREDVEKKLGLSVLVEIPFCDFNDTKLVKKGGRK